MMMTKMNRGLRTLSAGVALSLLLMAAPNAYAATPKDTLVEGFAFDDILSMDPAEAYDCRLPKSPAIPIACSSVSISTIRPRSRVALPKAGRYPTII